MIARLFIFFILLITGLNIYGQKRTITGIIVDEYLNNVPYITIRNEDSLVLGLSDTTGKFKVDLPTESNRLLFAAVGYEWKSITIQNNCNYLEIILLINVTYDFLPLEELNRLKKKRFKKLPKLYKKAYEKRIFVSEKPCYEEKFIPIKW